MARLDTAWTSVKSAGLRWDGQTPAEARLDEGEEQVQRSEAGYALLGPSTAGIARPELVAIEAEKTRQWCSQHHPGRIG
jgi:hypothetical protein